LRTYDRLSKREAKPLLESATKAVLLKLDSFRFKTKHNALFPPNFPHKRKVDETDAHVTWRVRADKMLDYLHSTGHSPYDYKTLIEHIRSVDLLAIGLTSQFGRLPTIQGESNDL
jgi:hypothetical protein